MSYHTPCSLLLRTTGGIFVYFFRFCLSSDSRFNRFNQSNNVQYSVTTKAIAEMSRIIPNTTLVATITYLMPTMHQLFLTYIYAPSSISFFKAFVYHHNRANAFVAKWRSGNSGLKFFNAERLAFHFATFVTPTIR